MMIPHPFQTKTTPLGRHPHIVISLEAYQKMWHYIDLCDVEIGWLGVVERDGPIFTIRDVCLLKQEVSSVTTTITEEGLSNLAQEILMKPDGVDTWNKMLFWGHSHVNMDTYPSTTDDTQMELFERGNVPFFIRGIFNKHGKAQFWIYFYNEGFIISDVPWSIEVPSDSLESDIQTEIDAKVTKVVYRYTGGYGGYGGYGGPQGSGKRYGGSSLVRDYGWEFDSEYESPARRTDDAARTLEDEIAERHGFQQQGDDNDAIDEQQMRDARRALDDVQEPSVLRGEIESQEKLPVKRTRKEK